MNFLKIILIFFLLYVLGCSSVRESAGVNRKVVDEYQVVENPPLVIPPDFNLLPPEQLEDQNIDEAEKELAQEILFGLEENENTDTTNINTMNKILLEAEVSEVSLDIREQIDEDFAQEKMTDGIFQVNWENEIEVLDAIKESERIRNKNFEGKSISEDDVPIVTEKIKIKKKKRFIFF